jgi:hypothetical protein
MKELKKKKIELTLSQKSDWMEFFENEKVKIHHLLFEIDKENNDVDRLVYRLYGLTEEEIQIVENN